MEPKFHELAKEFEKACKEGTVSRLLQKTPQALLPFRLSLGLSQKKLANKLKGRLSVPMIVKHEKGRTKFIRKGTTEILAGMLPSKVLLRDIMKNYTRFMEMKNGGFMTPENARKLQRVWLHKTTKKQRQEWGRLGAIKSNSGEKLTEQENEIKKLLDSTNVEYTIHDQIETNLLSLNIDFVLYKQNKPWCFIEVTKRKHDMAILCQAYAYRSRLLKESYPRATIMLVADNLSLMPARILEKEFDFVFDSNSMNKFSKFVGS
ncbi:MAG: hypothetical protein HY051_05350 [Candidatus Aenigmarchaeota archaeon]|nr:hypothetical protein [Candidatus Aenigmarchaeota archaeon]